jgi:hypothetical protein
MPTIVEQIQKDALDSSIPVSALLRRVKLAATKLKLDAIEDWVEKELKGYSSDIPDYRQVSGAPMGYDPYQGWQPIVGSGAVAKVLTTRRVGESVASLEKLAKAGPNQLHITYPAEIVDRLLTVNQRNDATFALFVGPNQIINILDQVRNLVLDWALNLEKAGILGTEFNFNAEEKQKAKTMSTTINIGQIGAFAGNLGSGNSSGDIRMTDIDVSQVHELLNKLKAHSTELSGAGLDWGVLKAKIDELESALKKRSPEPSILRKLLTGVQESLMQAAGNAIACGAIDLINRIVGTGVPSLNV